jgi:ABC-type nitrate/sulfonate/bicarbonate transport system permease component
VGEPLHTTARTRRSRIGGHLMGLLSVVVLIGAWEIAAHWLAATNPNGSELLPTVEHVLTTSIPETAGFQSRSLSEVADPNYLDAAVVLAQQSWVTLLRLLSGSAIGVLLGVLIGSLIATTRIGRAVFEPPVLAARNIPPLALIPLFVVWFGDREEGKVIYVAFVVFSMVVINTVHAIDNVDPVYVRYARTLGAKGRRIYTSVLLPAILPELAAGLKVVIGLSWAIVLAAEFIAADDGLGSLLIVGQTFFNVGLMLVVVILFVVYSLLMNAAFDRLTRHFARGLPQPAE